MWVTMGKSTSIREGEDEAMIAYHGSKNPSITSFRTDSSNFGLLGEGVYFYKKKESANYYGDYIYKVKIPSSLKISPLGFEFNDKQIERVFQKFKVPFGDAGLLPSGISNPLWWCTDGWDYFGLNRKTVANGISDIMQKFGYKGMLAKYPRGGDVVAMWDDYERLKPELIGKRAMNEDRIARELLKIAKGLVEVKSRGAAYTPDMFELSDWVIMEHPKVWNAVKRLHAKELYKFLLKFWKQQGKPEVD